jgi:3-phosphoshikimate 1-carboxyvinyltransferase
VTFAYRGTIGASKSILNRALIIKSYFPHLRLEGTSSCQDVQDLQKNLSQIGFTNEFQIAEGGTTFRFFCLRLSREAGEFKIKTSERLMARPQEELIDILTQLGVKAAKHPWGFSIKSEGWKKPKGSLVVERSRSSQFLSSLVLNSAALEFPLEIETKGETPSEDYFKMTLQMSKDLGLEYNDENNRLRLSWKNLKKDHYLAGADISSAFSLACFAAIGGDLQILNLMNSEFQPDYKFVSAFEDMNIPVECRSENLLVGKSKQLLPAALNLSQAPDLFPMMACLCTQIEGMSVLAGAPQLKYKESDRQKKVYELFDQAKISYEKLEDGIQIQGKALPHGEEFEFDPDEDHRMAMAAAFLKFAGWRIKIKNPQVVNKSFPEFWTITGVQP